MTKLNTFFVFWELLNPGIVDAASSPEHANPDERHKSSPTAYNQAEQTPSFFLWRLNWNWFDCFGIAVYC
jgi:hypothetical protein